MIARLETKRWYWLEEIHGRQIVHERLLLGAPKFDVHAQSSGPERDCMIGVTKFCDGQWVLVMHEALSDGGSVSSDGWEEILRRRLRWMRRRLSDPVRRRYARIQWADEWY